MYIGHLQEKWNEFGETDPLWAILAEPEKRGNKWQLEEFFATGQRLVDELMKNLRSLGMEVSRGRALDFGCGVGRLTQALAPYFDEVHGVDIAPSMIELARRYNRHGHRCQYHLNGSGDLRTFADNSMNLICSYIVLQHLEPRYVKKYIKELLRVLAPAGLLVFQLPSELSDAHNARRRLIIGLRTLIKPLLPAAVLNLYRRVVHGRQPIIDMFGIRRDRVVEFLNENGATIVDIRRDASAGKDWISFRYCVRKGSA